MGELGGSERDPGRGRGRPASSSTICRSSSRSSASSASRIDIDGLADPLGLQVGDGRYRLEADLLLGQAFDVAEQALLAGLGERDRHALASGPPDAADPVDVAVGRRRDVVVDDVGERVDVEAAGSDVGGDQQFGGAVAQAPHHPIALVLIHPAVQCLGPVAAPVHGDRQLVDLAACAAEHDRRRRRLDVEDASEGSGLVGPLHDVGALADERLAGLGVALADLDPDRVALVAAGRSS